MKKTLLATIAFLAVSAASATGTNVPSVTTSIKGSGSNQVTSSTSAGAFVNGAGSSISRAANTQTATGVVAGYVNSGSKPGNAFVNVDDCAPAIKLSGTKTTGELGTFGGVAVTGYSTASNVSTGAGTGGAEAAGRSYAEVAGAATLKSTNMDLKADGEAYGGVLTRATAGVNKADASSGGTSASFRSEAAGSLFTFNQGGYVGDQKLSSTNVVTRAGDLTCPDGKCGSTTTKSFSNNSTVEAGAIGNAYADVKASFNKP